MVGANACAALKHTLPMVRFYFIHSLLCVSNRLCSKDLEEGCFYMVLEGPFLNGTRLPVDRILLLGCWYLPITLNSCLLLGATLHFETATWS